MDCSVQPLRNNLSLISTTDFFYPLVDDPYLQGIVAAANVLSDLYAMGVVNCDNMLMTLAVSLEMQEYQREIVTRRMIQGFNDTARLAGTEVRGGQTVMNPWPIIGGMATSTCFENEFILPRHGQVGDVVVLTKPLGTQIAVNINEWIQDRSNLWLQIKDVINVREAEIAYNTAVKSMTRLNRNSARLMHKYKAHGATDITGFGIVGHATNLASNQFADVDIEIHTLPIIKKMSIVDSKFTFFNLMKGFSSETSGGLFIMLPSQEAAENFCREIQEIDGYPAWIVGRVVPASDPSNRKAFIREDANVVEIEF